MYNEQENLQTTVDRLAQSLKKFKDGPFEIILVNDGSSDDTWESAKKLAARPEYHWLRVSGYAHNRGRGYALRTGFAAARGEWIAAIDADLSYDPDDILTMTDVLREREDIDLVLASAYMPGGRTENVPLGRLLASRLGNFILSWFMSSSRQRVYTITCVVRAYRRHVLDSLELESDGKDIHLEILSKAMMLGYRPKEVPVVLRGRTRGSSKFQFRNTAVSHLIFALFEKPIIVFGLLGLFFLLGSIWGIALMTWEWWHGTLNPNRPLMTIIVLAFLGGLQLLSFGIIGTQFVTLRKEIIKIQARLRSLRKPNDSDSD